MKKMLMVICALLGGVLLVKAQSKFLSDIVTGADNRTNEGYTVINGSYWRYDTCLNSKQMCRYNTVTGFNVRVNDNNEKVLCEILSGNNSGYQSKNPYDTFAYFFSSQKINTSKLIRKLFIKEKYVKTDTFNLTPIDTLLYTNYSLIKRVFGKEVKEQKSLRIYVLKSVDEFGSSMLHYWVERIGIVKITDEKCWRYSFEMKDERTKPITKMYLEIMKLIKGKYKDPYWVGETCGIEK